MTTQRCEPTVDDYKKWLREAFAAARRHRKEGNWTRVAGAARKALECAEHLMLLTKEHERAER